MSPQSTCGHCGQNKVGKRYVGGKQKKKKPTRVYVINWALNRNLNKTLEYSKKPGIIF